MHTHALPSCPRRARQKPTAGTSGARTHVPIHTAKTEPQMPRPAPDRSPHPGPGRARLLRPRKAAAAGPSPQRLRRLRSPGPGSGPGGSSQQFSPPGLPLLPYSCTQIIIFKGKKRSKCAISAVTHPAGGKKKDPETPTPPSSPFFLSLSPGKLWPGCGSLSLLWAAVPEHPGSSQQPEVSKAELNQCSLSWEEGKKKRQQNCPRDRSADSFVSFSLCRNPCTSELQTKPLLHLFACSIYNVSCKSIGWRKKKAIGSVFNIDFTGLAFWWKLYLH